MGTGKRKKKIGDFVKQSEGTMYTENSGVPCVVMKLEIKPKSLFVAQFAQHGWMEENMRLIDAESTKNLARENFTDQTCLVAAVALIDEAETVDAVQVVRCRDCEHFGRLIVGEKHSCKNYQLPYCKPDDFCSYGKVKKLEAHLLNVRPPEQ